MKVGDTISGAIFSFDRVFRYALWRIWDKSRPALLFIGLNPSAAGEIRDDPTVRRVANYAKEWGYGGLYVGNLFALVSPDPVIYIHRRPNVTKQNDTAIKAMRALAADVLVGWGTWGTKTGTRPAEVLALVGDPVYCLVITKNGEPGHPLYLRSGLQKLKYERGK